MKLGKIKTLSLLGLGLGAVVLASCSNSSKTTEDNKNSSNTTNENVEGENNTEKGLSSLDYNFEQEFFYDDYNTRSKADATRQGIDTFENKDIVFDQVTYEELVNILESEGNYLILFGGSWCHNTRAVVPFVNDYAKQYGIEKVYNFDFYLDGTTGSTHVRNTTPTDESKITAGTTFNHLYGELVSRYLTNLTDFVEYKTGSDFSVTYTNSSKEATNVAKLQVPFLFLYNKDNTVNNSTGDGTKNTKGTYPVVNGFEEMIDLDEKGVYVYDRNVAKEDRVHFTDAYKGRLKTFFEFIKTNNIDVSTYEDSQYYKNLYNLKSKQEIFKDNDKINLKAITYRQLVWLLEQEGNSIILLGGTWCGNTQASIKTFNDLAVKNDVVIYNFDTKLDSGYATKYWGYKTDAHIRDTSNPFVRLYTDLIEKYFTNIETLYDVNAASAGQRIEYTNEAGEVVKVKKLQVPYLLSYNKNAVDQDNEKAPILASYEEMLSLSSTSKTYVYGEANYKSIKDNTTNVINAYLTRLGSSAQNLD